MRADGFYWIRFDDKDGPDCWEVGFYSDGVWQVCGEVHQHTDDDLLEIGHHIPAPTTCKAIATAAN